MYTMNSTFQAKAHRNSTNSRRRAFARKSNSFSVCYPLPTCTGYGLKFMKIPSSISNPILRITGKASGQTITLSLSLRLLISDSV